MLTTTYGREYKYSETLPPLRFRYFVSFLSDKEQLTPRNFPHYSLHIAPHRNLDYERSQLGFGPTGAPYERAEETSKKNGGQSRSESENNQDEEERENVRS